MSKRSHAVGTWDFIVIDDISGIKKLRSETFIDGYGFNSAIGDPRNPQEIAPVIREQMAAWPDPRPQTPAKALPLPPVVYFIPQYEVVSFIYDISSTLDAGPTICFNAPLADVLWYVDGVFSAQGIVSELFMDGGPHSIRMHLIDQEGNEGDYTFEYEQPTINVFAILDNDGLIILDNFGDAILDGSAP